MTFFFPKMRPWKTVLFISLLAFTLLSVYSIDPVKAPSYVPGVKVGDSWSYGRPDGFCLSPCLPGFSDFLNASAFVNQVTAVSGNYVTVTTAITFANGTTTSSDYVVNVETGVNITQGAPVIAAGLQQGDHIFDSPTAPIINYTESRVYAGATRQVNVLSITSGYPGGQVTQVSAWDQSTGVLAEFQLGAPSLSFHFRLVQTNLWSGPPDFTISVFPNFVVIPSSPLDNTTIQLPTVTVTSVSNFTGQVELIAHPAPNDLIVRFGISDNTTATLLIPPNGANQTALVPLEFPPPPPGTYYVSVTGVSGSLAHSVNVTIVVQPPSCGPPQCGIEALGLESYTFASSTSATLYLRNLNNSTINLVTYYVKDPQGNQYANTAFFGPTIYPGTVVPATFLIGSSCPTCTLAGAPFSFMPGNAYTITAVTSRNNQFTFTIVPGALTGDFAITASPDVLTFRSFISDPFPKTSTILVASLNGFSSNVTLTATVRPIVIFTGTNGTVIVIPPFHASVVPSVVGLSSGSVANATLFVSSSGAEPGIYAVNVTGTSQGISHSTIVTLQVVSPPDFNLLLSLTPLSTTIIAGQSSFIGVTLTNTAFGTFFNGTVTLTAQIVPAVPNGPVPVFNPSQISFVPPGQPFSTLITSTTTSTPPGNYTLIVTGTSGTLVHNVTVSLTILPAPTITLTPSTGTLGTLVTVHGSGFLGSQPPFAFPVQVEITFDNQFIGFIFLTNTTFDFKFNVPHADPTTPHHVHAIESIFPSNLDVQATFTYLAEPSSPTPLAIAISTGTIYFPGDTAVIYILATTNGNPVSVSGLHVVLIRPNGSNVTLSATPLSQGVWKATYAIPGTGSIGTYALVARGAGAGNVGSSLTTFEVKQTWLQGNGRAVGTSLVGAIGAVGVLMIAWKRGVFTRRKDEIPII